MIPIEKLCLWCALIFYSLFCFGGGSSFKLELSYVDHPVSLYQGESIKVDFVLRRPLSEVSPPLTLSTSVNLEIVRFPEFHGFWSHNLMLRQGPLILSPAKKKYGLEMSAIIASYLLTPRVSKGGREEYLVNPMLVTLDQNPDNIIRSEGDMS